MVVMRLEVNHNLTCTLLSVCTDNGFKFLFTECFMYSNTTHAKYVHSTQNTLIKQSERDMHFIIIVMQWEFPRVRIYS